LEGYSIKASSDPDGLKGWSAPTSWDRLPSGSHATENEKWPIETGHLVR
jgi:hypothetical protein